MRFLKLGDKNSVISAGKTVIEYELIKLMTEDIKAEYMPQNYEEMLTLDMNR